MNHDKVNGVLTLLQIALLIYTFANTVNLLSALTLGIVCWTFHSVINDFGSVKALFQKAEKNEN